MKSAQGHEATLFSYLQIEASDISYTTFRFDERTHDAVVVSTKTVRGEFLRHDQVQKPVAEFVRLALKERDQRLIIGAHSGLCATVQTVTTMRRQQVREHIDEAELESLIASALWKAISSKQAAIATQLGVSEAMLVPIAASLVQVRVDGHRVATPVGFPAHTVEFTFRFTVVPRSIYTILMPVIGAEQESYITEIGLSELLQVGARKKNERAVLVRVSDRYTYVYQSDEDGCEYRDTIHWGKHSLLGVLTQALMISEGQATELLRRADEGLVSDQVRRKIDALLLEEAAVLLKAVGVYARQAEVVYLESPFILPDSFLGEAAARRAGISVPLLLMPSNPHGGKVKIALLLRMKSGAPSLAMLCANAAVANRFFEESDLQKIVKRRVRWLASSVT